MEFHPEPADLGALIGDLVSTMSVLVEKKELDVAVEIAPEVRSVVVDRARLKQVLYNYLSNAIKFTPEQGRLTVRVEPRGSESFRLAVADTGVGIGPEDQQKLFQEFQQLDLELSQLVRLQIDFGHVSLPCGPRRLFAG